MEIKNVKQDEKKNIPISVRTSKRRFKFLKDHSISPTKVFNEAVDELMEKKE